MKRTYIVLVVSLLVLASCSAKQQAGASFQEQCAKTGGMWMTMHPTKNGIPTGEPACAGCMQSKGDHICDQGRYMASLK